MRILKQKEGGKAKPAKYTRKDFLPVQGATVNVKWYIVEEGEKPKFDANLFRVKETIITTEEKNKEYPAFFKAIATYEKEQLSTFEILDNLNGSFGSHIDETYPVWKRIKHNTELLLGTTKERETYIKALKKAEFDCRDERDKKENDLLSKNQIPSFDWKDKNPKIK